MATPNITEKISRSLTLLRVFVLASAIVLVAAALVLATLMTRAVRQQAMDDAQVSLTEYTNGVLHREIVHGGQISVSHEAKDVVNASFQARSDILSVKVWRPDGDPRLDERRARAHRREVPGLAAPGRGHRDGQGRGRARGARRRREHRGVGAGRPRARGLCAGHRRRLCGRGLRDLRGRGEDRELDRFEETPDLVRDIHRVRAAVGDARPARPGRVEHAPPPDGPAPQALEGPHGRLREARGELARGDREP